MHIWFNSNGTEFARNTIIEHNTLTINTIKHINTIMLSPPSPIFLRYQWKRIFEITIRTLKCLKMQLSTIMEKDIY